MDGNNRWSKKKNISKYYSYKQGANKLIEITNFIFENYDINYVSAFALSKHNFKRGSVLIDIIRKVLVDFLDSSKDINNFKYRIKFNGDLSFLPKNIVENIKKIEKNNPKSKKKLIIFLNYSGKDDIVTAAKSLIQSQFKKINHKIFQNYLLSSTIPDPEILIRSGGYKRVSDFMLYQISFTELFFTNKLWPSLTINDVKKFIEQFNKIDRKFGN
tara:strand:+ start:947 stop:1591 length:645 start_codon:yes stop_codon:yes gene_type:complete